MGTGIVLGAGREIGRSCISLKFGNNGINYLIDAGIKMDAEENLYPLLNEEMKNIWGVFLTHEHLDHIGSLPILVKEGLDCNVITTTLVKEFALYVLRNSYYLEGVKGQVQKYGLEDLQRAVSMMSNSYEGHLGTIHYNLIPNGHVPGSVAVYLHDTSSRKRVLATGDFKCEATRLMKACQVFPRGVDLMIADCTYGDKEVTPRNEAEKKLEQVVKKTLKRGGSVFLPVLSIGRAQELMCVLHSMRLGVPMYIEGMACPITDICIENIPYLKDDALKYANKCFQRISQKEDWLDWEEATSRQGIFLSTSGMVNGPILEYIKKFWSDKKSSIILTSYQPEGTNGRRLLTDGTLDVGGWYPPVCMEVHSISFSAHSGKSELEKVIREVNPGLLLAQHGSPEAVDSIVSYAESIGVKAIAPGNGESFEF